MTVVVNHLTLAPEQKLLRLRDVEEVEVDVDVEVCADMKENKNSNTSSVLSNKRKMQVQAPVHLALGFDGGEEEDLVLAPMFWGSVYEQFLDYSFLVTQDSMEVLKS